MRATILCFVIVLGLSLSLPERSNGEEGFRVDVGLRGGTNLKEIGIAPFEKEDFEQYDVFAIVGRPWNQQSSSVWVPDWRLRVSAGVLKGGGDSGFITTLTPGFAITNTRWGVTVDAGAGGALISDHTYGRQNLGGAFQIVAHGGIGVELGWNIAAGWRFHHISDAGIHGTNRGVDINFLELSYHF